MTLSNNTDLPPLPAWQARSFWLALLTGLSALMNALGVDAFGALSEMGLGSSPDAVLDNAARGVSAIQQVMPLITGVWMWLERRAPNFRLVFWRKPSATAAVVSP